MQAGGNDKSVGELKKMKIHQYNKINFKVSLNVIIGKTIQVNSLIHFQLITQKL